MEKYSLEVWPSPVIARPLKSWAQELMASLSQRPKRRWCPLALSKTLRVALTECWDMSIGYSIHGDHHVTLADEPNSILAGS